MRAYPGHAMSSLTFNLKHLRGFRTVARTHSITQAAGIVALSQPALTQAMAKLEKQCGQDLLERKNSGIYLTTAGETLQGRVAEALDALAAGVKRAMQIARRDGVETAPFETRLTLTQLRALVAVSAAQNFSLAAEREGLSQPSINAAARDLEKIAGFPCYLKRPHGIELTDAARVLALHAGLMFRALQNGIEEIEALAGRDARLISAGTVSFMARSDVLPDAISAFLRVFPEATVKVHDGLFSHLMARLRSGEIDFLVGAMREGQSFKDVEQRLLTEDPLTIIARADHPLAGNTKLTWQVLSEYGWVLPRKGTPTRDFFELQMKKIDGAQVHIVESSTPALLRGLLAQSDRLALTSAQHFQRELEVGLLTRLNFDLGGYGRRIGVAIRKGWRPTASQEMFLALIEGRDPGPM